MTTIPELAAQATSPTDTTTAFARWEDGELSAREALTAIVSAEYVAADAAFKAAEQRKKQVRSQLEQLVRAIGEPVVCAGFELAWRDGSVAPSYPAQRVDWAVRTLQAALDQLLGCPQIAQEAPVLTDDEPLPDTTYRVPHALIAELIATVEHLAAGREERSRAGALYIVSEEAKQRQERRQAHGQAGEETT